MFGEIWCIIEGLRFVITHTLHTGALTALLERVRSDASVAPRRIALFSLGNFVSHAEARSVLESMPVPLEEVLSAAARLSPRPWDRFTSRHAHPDF